MENNIILYTTKDNKIKVELYQIGDNVWLTQNDIAKLFSTSKQNIALHIKNILAEGELRENSVVKQYLTTALDGKSYNINYYSLEMILSIGFRVRGKQGIQFRIWANEHLWSYLQKGFVIDNDRLKNPNGRTDYFDELLEQIRDIRASEKRFYQKLRDLFSLSIDYDSTDKATQMFFAEVQNKFLYAVTNKTAAEIIYERSDENKLNMGLTTWKGTKVKKSDIIIAKNYSDYDEIDNLNRLVNIFLDSAELRAKNNETLSIGFWKQNVDDLLKFQNEKILKNKGSISNSEAEKIAKERFDSFNDKRKKNEARQANDEDIKILESAYKHLNKR